MNIQQLIHDTKEDSELFENLNIDELIKNAEKSQHLENKSWKDVLEEKIDALEELDLDTETEKLWLDRLSEYRYVKNIYEIHKGKFLRWIKKTDDAPKLTNGSFVSEILFLDDSKNNCIAAKKEGWNVIFVNPDNNKITDDKGNTIETITDISVLPDIVARIISV